LKFAGASSASVRYGSPAFILKLIAVVNSSQWFASVRQGSSALLSALLSNGPSGPAAVRRIEQVMESAGKAGASHTEEVRPPR